MIVFNTHIEHLPRKNIGEWIYNDNQWIYKPESRKICLIVIRYRNFYQMYVKNLSPIYLGDVNVRNIRKHMHVSKSFFDKAILKKVYPLEIISYFFDQYRRYRNDNI